MIPRKPIKYIHTEPVFSKWNNVTQHLSKIPTYNVFFFLKGQMETFSMILMR